MDMLMLLPLLWLQYGQGDSKTCSVDPASNRVGNAALNKPATQISTYSTGTASKANDGDNNPLFSYGSCMHTLWKYGLPLYQWWMVDLEKEYIIESVNITNRLSSEERQRDFDIYVSFNSTFEDDDHMTDDSLCIHVSGVMGRGETRTFTCQTQVFGQFVQIYMETLDGRDMNICEVTVEGYVAVCIEDITTESSLTTKNASAVITTSMATSTALSTTPTTSVSSTIPTTTDATLWKTMTTSMWLLETTPITPKTTSAVAATTPTKTTTTETGERSRTTSTSASTTTEIASASSTIPTATSKTTTILKRTSPWPVLTTLKTVATTTAVTTSTSMTLSTLVSLPGNTTTVSTSTCPCVCIVSSNTTNLTQEARLELVKELRKELTIDKKETSISKRKLISVGDERQSAETIGFIGVLALCVPVLLIVSFDLINLWSSAKQKKTRAITK